MSPVSKCKEEAKSSDEENRSLLVEALNDMDVEVDPDEEDLKDL